MIVRILMVDDHPSMLEGYKIILSYNTLGFEIETTSVFNCESAYEIITKKSRKVNFDLIFLDYSLPPYEKKGIMTGEDLAMLAKIHMPNSKIVMLTSHTEALVLYTILRNVEPAGMLVKSDFSADELLQAFDLIMKGEIYHSATVKQSMKELLSKKVYLDNFNREIITLLAQGIKTKSLPNHLNLSMSSIEKRKVQIKDYLGIEKGSDEDIIKEAKRRGLI